MTYDDDLLFGILDPTIFDDSIEEQIARVEDSVENYSYSEVNPPHFTKCFTFLVKQFSQCKDVLILSRLADILGNIAGYKLGMNVRNVLTVADKIMMTLLCQTDKTCIASAVNFFRKTARVVGPRFVFTDFIRKHAKNTNAGTGIAILVHQLIIDFPKFKFELEDFDGWVYPLSAIPGVGYQLVSAIRGILPEFDDYDKDAIKRPPSVPLKSLNQSAPPPLPPNSARPTVCPRLLPRRISTRTDGSVFQLTERQTAVREFVDQPFQPGEKPGSLLEASIPKMVSKEWEDRSESYNTVRRIMKYEPDIITDDTVHSIVTATLDDIESPRAALALSAMGLLQETVNAKADDMELEIARVIPVVMKRFAKSAQFFEQALTEFMNIAVRKISPKRFVSLMIINGDTKSPKVQTAVAEYTRNSLHRCVNNNEKLFRKNSKDLNDIIVILNKLVNASVKSARDPAKECVSLLSTIYGDSFATIVQKALPDGRAAADFIRSAT